jgi:mono/diheme cytochrome c family protein
MIKRFVTLAAAAFLLPPMAQAAPADPTYTSRCAMCHQTGAVGLPGQYPRLAGRVGVMASKPEGRRYLALVLLNGMIGSIDVEGKPIFGVMPTFASVKDQDIANTLNYLIALQPPAKKPAAFTAAEIAKVRAEPRIAGAQVSAQRKTLVAAKVIP